MTCAGLPGTNSLFAAYTYSYYYAASAELVCQDSATVMSATAVVSTSTRTVTLSSKLLYADDNAPVRGRTVAFSTDSKSVCTATTNADGLASCSLPMPLVNRTLAKSYTASFTGDGTAGASSATATTTR